jgi:tetratricopeptide (TPR) repeat protein
MSRPAERRAPFACVADSSPFALLTRCSPLTAFTLLTLLMLLMLLTLPAQAATPARPPAAPCAQSADEVTDLNDRARAALDAGRPGEAVGLLERALALAPEEDVVRRNLAWAYFRRGQQELAALRLERAALDYRKAVEHNPDEPGYRLHLGQLLLRRYQLDEAERVLRALVAEEGAPPDAWLILGDVLSLQDELPEAKAAYDRAAVGDDEQVAAIARTAAARTARQHLVEHDYRTDVTPYFIIRGPAQGSGPLFGVRLANLLDRARAEVCAALGVNPQRKATVVLYPPEAFREVTGTHEWVGGLFDRKIRLPIADVERDRELIEASFKHEFTHLVISDITPACPTFVNEGLAEVMGQGRGGGLAQLAAFLDAQPGGREALPRIAELPASFMDITDRTEVNRAYLLSYAFLDHVVAFHSASAAMRWVTELGSQPLAEAYQAATGRTLADEEALFRERLRTVR